mgnify:CR=1 FL=1
MATAATTTRKVQITTARYNVLADFDYLTAGRTYDVEIRSNSRDVDFRRTDGSGIGCYVRRFEFNRALAAGLLVEAV